MKPVSATLRLIKIIDWIQKDNFYLRTTLESDSTELPGRKNSSSCSSCNSWTKQLITAITVILSPSSFIGKMISDHFALSLSGATIPPTFPTPTLPEVSGLGFYS